MKPDNIQKYISLMAEIKRRTLVVDSFTQGKTHSVYKATTVETIYLQFRKILELIAMGSLVANKKEFSKIHTKFSNYWNAEKIINDIEKLNSNFYPTPIKQNPCEEPEIKSRFEKIPDSKHLTKSDFVSLYKKCGAILHAENPYGKKIDYDSYNSMAVVWRQKIRNLLNAHEIRLINDENLYLIQMGAMDASPSYTVFAPVEKT
ncbi:MAG: hypothetical protein V1706_14860 [Pseudomonadota bacterium]